MPEAASTVDPPSPPPEKDWRDAAEGLLRPVWPLLLALLLAAVAVPLAVRALKPGGDAKGDTRFYVRGGAQFLAGGHLYLDLAPSGEVRGTTSYTYPPPFAAVCAPLVPLPYAAVRVAWLAVMTAAAVGATAVALRWLRASAPARPGDTARPCLLVVLALLPLVRFGINDLAHGQVNWLLALLVAAALLLAGRGRDAAGGACLGAALVIKPTAWPLFAWYAADRRWRLLAAACAAAAVAFVPIVLRYGPAGAVEQTTAWFVHMRGFADLEAFARENVALSALLGKLLAGTFDAKTHAVEPLVLSLDQAAVRPWVRGLATAIVLAGLGWVAVRRSGSALAPAALLPLAALASPVTWKAHLVGLLPALLVVAHDVAESARPPRRAVLLWLALLVLFAGPSRGLLDLDALERAGATTLGLAVLFVALARRESPAPRVTAPPTS